MTTNNFDVDGHLATLGRLDTPEIFQRPSTLTLKPGRPTGRHSPFDKSENVMFPYAVLAPVMPADMPREVYPLIVGPVFKWVQAKTASEKVEAIRGARIVYDERGSDLDQGELFWSRMHAAYLLNEIVPDLEITIHLLTSDADSIPASLAKDAIETATSFAENELDAVSDDDGDQSAVDFLLGLLKDEDDDFSFGDDPFSFEEPDFHLGRTIAAKVWHEELLPLARQHFTFMTNARIFVQEIAKRFCTPAADTASILANMKPAVSAAIANEMKLALNAWDIGHPVVLLTLFAIADSTAAERMALFDELVTAEKPEHIQPTLGNIIVAGRYFGSTTRRMRTQKRAANAIGLLIGAGVVAFDTDDKTVTLTEGGRKYVEAIGPSLHVREYQRGVVDQLGGHVDPSVIGPTAEAVLMEYFQSLKAKIADLDATF